MGLRGHYRPSASLEVLFSPNVNVQRLPVQWVSAFTDPAATATYGSRYVFANFHQNEISLETRINYVLSPKMSLQVYMQPLVSVGDYQNFKELARARAYDFTRFGIDRGSLAYDAAAGQYIVDPGDGGAPFEFSNPDFNLKSLRLNAIFRWEWRPGSAMYFVWTQQRHDVGRPGQFAFGRDLRTLFGARPDDVILFKIAYWFNR
jgi:hypothetical protein